MTAPVASYSYDYDTLVVPCRIQFMDTSSNTPTRWRWKFGDGTTSTVKSPEKYYTKYGDFIVTLRATNADGTNTTFQTISVKKSSTALELFIGFTKRTDYLLANSISMKKELQTRKECKFTLQAETGAAYHPLWGHDVSIYDWNSMVNRDGFSLSFNGTNSYIQSDYNFTFTNRGFVYIQFYRARTNVDETLFNCSDNPEIRLNNDGTISVMMSGATGMTNSAGKESGRKAIGVGWHEVCFIWGSSYYYLYIDGSLYEYDGSATFPASTSARMYLGSYNGTSRYFSGKIDEWSVFDYALDFSYTNLWRRGDFPLHRHSWNMAALTNTYITYYKYDSSFNLTGAFDDAGQFDYGGTNSRGYIFSNISKVAAEKRWPEKVFGGTIWEINEYDNELPDQVWYDCDCIGYEELCDRLVVDNDYYQRYAQDLFEEIISKYMSYDNIIVASHLLGADNVFIPTSKFKMLTVSQCMDELCTQTGRMWWVDDYRAIHFVPVGYYTSKVNIIPGSPISNLKIKRNKEDYVNTVWAEGKPIEIKVEGWTDDRYTIKIPASAIPSNRILDISGGANPGTSGYYESEGDRDIIGDFRAIIRDVVDNNVYEYICIEEGNPQELTDHPDWTLMYRKDTPIITFRGDVELPISPQYLAVHCSYRQRTFELARDDNAINARNAIEMYPSGLYSKCVQVDYSSRNDIQKAAWNERNAYQKEEGKEILSFDCYLAGIRPGQVMTCFYPQHNINGTYLIYDVNIVDEDKTLLKRSISAIKGTLQNNWLNYWKKIVSQKKTFGSGAGVGGGGGSGGDQTPNPTNPTVFADQTTANDSLVVTHNP